MTDEAQGADASNTTGPTSRVAKRLLEKRQEKKPESQAPGALSEPSAPQPPSPMDAYIPEMHDEFEEPPKRGSKRPSAPTERHLLGEELRRALDEDIEDELAEALAEIDAKGDYAAAAPTEGDTDAASANLEPGSKVTVRVIDVRGDDVFVDLGGKSEGFLPVVQFGEKLPSPGDRIEVIIDRYDDDNDVHILRRPGEAQAADWGSIQKGSIVDVQVKAANKGGLEVTASGLRGFLPAGQVDIGRVEDLSTLIGKTLRCEVIEANAASRNLVVSRRKVQEREREELAKETRASLEVGQTREGIVRKLMDFGAFVDIGGVDGLIHVSQLSWRKVRHPKEVLREGETVKVQVLSYEPETGKLGLGLRQLHENPWHQVAMKYAPGSIVAGKITRTAEFGAFVELEPGIEGLIHISELSGRRISRVTEVVHENDAVDVKVIEVDVDRQRIALSLKGAAAAAAEAAEDAAAQEAPEEPKKKGKEPAVPLKGGLGRSGPLFG